MTSFRKIRMIEGRSISARGWNDPVVAYVYDQPHKLARHSHDINHNH